MRGRERKYKIKRWRLFFSIKKWADSNKTIRPKQVKAKGTNKIKIKT